MPRLKPGRIIPTDAEDAAITAAAQSDPDARPLTDEEWQAAAPKARVGSPLSAMTKQAISIRLSPEVLDYFKSAGPGWQTRIDAVLREYVASH
jgi:uncharacterized protein (DUF4415 family)